METTNFDYFYIHDQPIKFWLDDSTDTLSLYICLSDFMVFEKYSNIDSYLERSDVRDQIKHLAKTMSCDMDQLLSVSQSTDGPVIWAHHKVAQIIAKEVDSWLYAFLMDKSVEFLGEEGLNEIHEVEINEYTGNNELEGPLADFSDILETLVLSEQLDDHNESNDDTHSIGELLELLKNGGVTITMEELINHMRELNFLYDNDNAFNIPSNYAIEQGFVMVHSIQKISKNGNLSIIQSVKLTHKGFISLVESVFKMTNEFQ